MKDKSSCIVCVVGPMELVDELVVLDGVACSHELEDTCVGNEMAASAEELLCANSSDVVGECFS